MDDGNKRSRALVKKAELIEVGERLITSDARYHKNLFADYAIRQFASDPEKWISPREAANVMYHSGITSNQEKIIRKYSELFNELQARGYSLVVEPTTKHFKIYSGADSEKQYMFRKREYWRDRRERSEDKEAFITNVLIEEALPEDRTIKAS